MLTLGFGFDSRKLHDLDTLSAIDAAFLDFLTQHDPTRANALRAYRTGIVRRATLEESEMLIACAEVLDAFVAELFDIEDDAAALSAATLSHNPIFRFKKFFVLRRARRRLALNDVNESFAELDLWLAERVADSGDRELAVARYAGELLDHAESRADDVDMLTRWCIRALSSDEGKAAVRGWVSFHFPQGVDHRKLVATEPASDGSPFKVQGPQSHWRIRDGFRLTDRRADARTVQREIDYCLYCHKTRNDNCSKGFPEDKDDPEKGFRTNPLGDLLVGCPLDEKISEMHVLKRDGFGIGALAMVMAENPMCAATGHRICNDCMRSCIYQKQDPVNVPQIETRVLTDVLALPWGVEIYDLFTRWNPLRQKQWLPQPYHGGKVLIAGMGPAGFTLAHHLLMEGFAVVGIDGLKIEPLPDAFLTSPVRDYADLEDQLDTRVMAGFGGVAEYGITVRWDKNFLKLIYLVLARRPYFQVFGGVRLGGTVTFEDAWQLGFDHVAIATGAGLPKALPIPNSLARGMRQANDFLMALQLTGAAKTASLTNLQVRLPAVVIGGGLTGIDTATEVQAYYLVQIEKCLARYETLSRTLGEARIREQLDQESLAILDEFLEHGRELRTERARAEAESRAPKLIELLRRWGGVSVIYRRAMNESPAYIRNFEEIVKAFEEGIFYAEGMDPAAVEVDEFNHVEALICTRQTRDETGIWHATDERVRFAARAIFVATGAAPNTIYERERPGTLAMRGMYFETHDCDDELLKPVPEERMAKGERIGFFTSYAHDDKRVSFVGDTHPAFHGSVVKAIASAMRAYPKISALLEPRKHQPATDEYIQFRNAMHSALQARVDSVRRVSPSVVEVDVAAPMAARNFRPGQFFRLQNYERLASVVEDTRLQTESLALTGAGVEAESGIVKLMVLEVGASSRLCATLKAGEPIVLMGPTGAPSQIPQKQNVLVLAGRRGAAVMRTLGPLMRANGNRVLYFAGFRTADEAYSRDELEQAADYIVWCTLAGRAIETHRPTDLARSGDFIETVRLYAEGQLVADPPLKLSEIDRVFVIGSERLLRMAMAAKKGVLKNHFKQEVEFTASVGSPMQCMLKGVCAQCLQWQIDPETGERTRAVFTCAGQDQPLEWIDIDNLDARLAQNRAQEKLTDLWLDHLLSHAR